MATDVGTLQGKLELDMSGFNKAMNQATNLVRQFGQQLQGALGSAATQGFSATNSAVQSLAAEMLSLTTNANNLIAVLGQVNTQLQGFLNTMQTSSSLGANMNSAAQGAQNTANATGQVANNTQNASAGANQLNNNLNRAGKNARNTTQNTNGAATGANKAANNAKKLSNNLQSASTFAANVKHILEGIMISQSFYRLLGIMQDLVSNANQFMTYMEQSSVSFKYLIGSAEDANGFLTALQDFAVSSPLDMQGATKSARMLMTMGVEAENTVGVLRVLTDAAVVAGGDMEDSIYRISLALGQMLQSGTVKAQEIRQLVNANIPIFEILQEELGLTAQQVANIGKEGINSATAVNAILRGLQKRFQGASKDMQKTLTGALSACKDSFYVLYNIAMQGPFNAIREKVVALSEALQYLAQVARNFGMGGVFETIVPGWLQPYIRNVIGALKQLGYALKYAALIAKDLFGAAFVELTQIFSLILPPITIFLNALLQLAHYLLQTYPILRYVLAAFLTFSILTKIGAIVAWFWKIMGLGKICLMVANWVGTLMKALAWLAGVMVTHPAVLIFTLIAGAALVATGAIQKLINKFKELFSMIGVKWAKMNKTLNEKLNIGYDPNKILQPVDKKDQDNADKYNGTLKNIAGSLEDVGDEADKAGKKLKQNFNQSFDEVYTINPNQDVANDLGLGDLGNLDLSDAIGQLDDFSDALGDIGGFDFSGWDQDFIDEWDKMWQNIKDYLKNFGLGALLAGLLTTLLTGNPWLGLAAALAALFWPAIADKLGLTKDDGQKILGAALGALLGAVIAKICKVGFLKGALWSGIGALIFAGLWPAIQEYMDSGDWRKALKALDFTLFGAGIGALIGNMIGGPIGAAIGGLIGAAIGNGLEGGIDAFANGGSWQQIVQGFNWTTLGTGIGALIGQLMGGPLGAAVGAAIGFALGDGINGAIQAWANGENGWQIADAANWTEIGAGLGTIIGMCIAGPLGAAIGTVIGGLVGFIADKIAEVLAAIDGDWEIAGDAFKLWGQDIATAFKEGLFGEGGLFGWSTEIFKFAGEFFADIKDAFAQGDWLRIGKDILLGILNGLLGAITFIFEPISRLFRAIVNAICAIFGIHSPAKEMEPIGKNILLGLLEGLVGAITAIPGYVAKACGALISTIGSWFTDIGEKVTGWLSDAKTAVGTWVTETGGKISTWVTDRVTDFTTWATDTKAKVTTWVTETGSSIGTWVTDRVGNFTTFVTETYNKVSTWVTDTKTSIGGWITDTATSIGTWVTDRVTNFTTFVSTTKEKISGWVTDTKTKFGDWVTSTKEKISGWVTNTKEKVTSWSTATKEKLSNWTTDTKSKISTWATDTKAKISSWATDAKSKISTWATDTAGKISTWWTNCKSKFDSFKGVSFSNWCSSTLSTLSDWASNVWGTIKDKIGSAISKVKEFLGLSSKDSNINVNVSGGSAGHATGGVFNREHWAKFAEGNKAEAIIPLENESAMQPFVDAVSNGLTASLAPIVASINTNNGSNNLQPLYVGTLVADERGLKELERKMQIIRVKEDRRG